MSGPQNTHPYVELVFVAVMTAGNMGMHKQETNDNPRGFPFERCVGQVGTLSFLVSPRHLEKSCDLILGWSHPILFSQLSNLCTKTLCPDKNTIAWFSYLSPFSTDVDLPALASPIQSLFQVLLSFHMVPLPPGHP